MKGQIQILALLVLVVCPRPGWGYLSTREVKEAFAHYGEESSTAPLADRIDQSPWDTSIKKQPYFADGQDDTVAVCAHYAFIAALENLTLFSFPQLARGFDLSEDELYRKTIRPNKVWSRNTRAFLDEAQNNGIDRKVFVTKFQADLWVAFWDDMTESQRFQMHKRKFEEIYEQFLKSALIKMKAGMRIILSLKTNDSWGGHASRPRHLRGVVQSKGQWSGSNPNHAVFISKYEPDGNYFVVKNSWGIEAGDGGYFYVPLSALAGNSAQLTGLTGVRLAGAAAPSPATTTPTQNSPGNFQEELLRALQRIENNTRN